MLRYFQFCEYVFLGQNPADDGRKAENAISGPDGVHFPRAHCGRHSVMVAALVTLFALRVGPPGFGHAPIASQIAQAQTFPTTFTFESGANAKTVSVAGTFNNWSATANPMTRVAGTNQWKLTLPLQAGDYQYKFVVDGSQWTPDPNAKNVNDGNGNINSELTVFPPDYKTPAKIGDGQITWSAVNHQVALPYLNWDREFEGGQLTIRLRLRPNDVQKVEFLEAGHAPMTMAVSSTDSVYQFDSVTLPWKGSKPLTYSFRLQDGNLIRYYGPNGSTPSPRGNEFQVSSSDVPSVSPPGWVQHTVFYQIFPDRFSDGNSQDESETNSKWNTAKNDSNWVGGNIAGMQSHFDYLKSLGISGIYFNPIFETSVYHGYETVDYLKIDHRFGTNPQFATFTQELQKAGIRTVLDGVFNHTSTHFFPFADVVSKGASSPYVDWYSFYGFPVKIGNPPNYKAWWNYPSLPVLNHTNPEVIKYLLNVPQFWNEKATISGWRLDAAQEVPDSFWHIFHTKVKGINPQDWIVGEDWGNSSSYIDGNMWDSVMNYPFLFAVWDFVGQKGSAKPTQLASKLQEIYVWYTPQTDRNLMNLIDSHDTIRILTECGGDSALRNIAAELEFSWIGAPTVYYGDELGMDGGKDPDNRNPMDWRLDIDSNATLTFYKTLIAARNGSVELQMGSPEILLADDEAQTLAFARVYDRHAALSVVNRSNETQSIQFQAPAGVEDQTWIDVLSGKVIKQSNGGTIRLNLLPKSSALLLPESEAKTPAVSAATSSLLSTANAPLSLGQPMTSKRRLKTA